MPSAEAHLDRDGRLPGPRNWEASLRFTVNTGPYGGLTECAASQCL